MGLVLGQHGRRSRESVAWGHDRAHHGNAVIWVKGVHSPGALSKGYRRVDVDVHDVCLHLAGRVRLRQRPLAWIADKRREGRGKEGR